MNGDRFLAASLGLAVLVLAGCNTNTDGLNHGGELSGMVTLGDKPLGGGRVEVSSDDGKNSVFAEIRPDGSYTVVDPPLGDCKVVVLTSYLKGMKPPGQAGAGGAEGSRGMTLPKDVGLVYTAIPPKYESRQDSGLTVNVKRGKQPHDIKLLP